MAAQFISEFTQDLHGKLFLRHGGQITFEGDSQSIVITLHLTDNGAAYSGGGTVSGTAIRTKDGATVPLTGSISEGTVTVTLIANCFYAPGAPINVYVKLTSGSVTTTVLAVVYDVLETSTSNVIDPSSEISLEVADLIDAIAEAKATIPGSYETLMYSIAPAYTDLTFPIDAYKQFCWYNGQLYVNIVDIPSSESWTSAHWAETDISGEFASLLTTLVMVSDTQPSEPYNRIWIKETTPEGVQIPTYAEFTALQSIVDVASTSDTKSYLGIT